MRTWEGARGSLGYKARAGKGREGLRGSERNQALPKGSENKSVYCVMRSKTKKLRSQYTKCMISCLHLKFGLEEGVHVGHRHAQGRNEGILSSSHALGGPRLGDGRTWQTTDQSPHSPSAGASVPIGP